MSGRGDRKVRHPLVKSELQRKMDVFDGPYYRINKFFLTCLGQWPYQNNFQKRLIRTALFIFVVSVIYPEILYLMAWWGDMDAVIESISAISVELSTSMKMCNYILNTDKMKIILNRIRQDWQFNVLGPQSAVLMKYADEGRKLTIFYAAAFICLSWILVAYLYATLLAYTMFPLMPMFLDYFLERNQSVPEIPFPIKYGDFDPKKYYFPMMIHSNCTALLIITTIVAADTIYLVYVQHACGVFAAIGNVILPIPITYVERDNSPGAYHVPSSYGLFLLCSFVYLVTKCVGNANDRLEHLIEPSTNEKLDEYSAEQEEEATYQKIVSCVKLHSEVIVFAETVGSTYTVVFFFLLGLSVFCMSLAGYQTLVNLDKPNEAIRFATFTLAQVTHIFILSYPGQKLIDHSERIHEWVYGSQWFEVSARSKRLLMIMMHRSIKPCSISAGKFYIMSYPNFSLILQTSVSYFTVLTSFS